MNRIRKHCYFLSHKEATWQPSKLAAFCSHFLMDLTTSHYGVEKHYDRTSVLGCISKKHFLWWTELSIK